MTFMERDCTAWIETSKASHVANQNKTKVSAEAIVAIKPRPAYPVHVSEGHGGDTGEVWEIINQRSTS